jgi:HD-GYP domain-containing protein (c-di-GMP phosphodiesterase class II)
LHDDPGASLHPPHASPNLRALLVVDSRTRLLALGTFGTWAALAAHRRRERKLCERVAAAALEALLNAIDANDAQTGAHLRRVAAYALVLARAAGLDAHDRNAVEHVALYHDIGKINGALFDIVHEEDRLSPRERALIDTHPRLGADVIRPLTAFYPELYEGVLSHHERWDGSGYPRHLRGLEIPNGARIVSIADSFDVITHGRRYAHVRTIADARRAIADGRGTQFEPALVDLFVSPPVFAEVVKTFHRTHAPRILRAGRRAHESAAPGPDLSFRWKTGATARPVPDRER